MPANWDAREAGLTPATNGRCVYCGGLSLFVTGLTTGEVLCYSCLCNVLRPFGRHRFVDILVDAGLEPATRRTILEWWEPVIDDLAREYSHDDGLYPIPPRHHDSTPIAPVHD